MRPIDANMLLKRVSDYCKTAGVPNNVKARIFAYIAFAPTLTVQELKNEIEKTAKV